MSLNSLILENQIAIINKLNEIQANAKRTEEFPEQNELVATSKIRVSNNTTSEWLEIQKLIDSIIEIVQTNGVEVWSAQTYEEQTVVIYNDDIYLLSDNSPLPFESTNFLNEFNQGNWIKLSGLGVKHINIPYPTVMDDSSFTIDEYLSDIDPTFEIRKGEILSVTYFSFDTGDGDITPISCRSTYALPKGVYGNGVLDVSSNHKIGFSKITTKTRDVLLSSEHHPLGFTKTNGLPVSGGSAIFHKQEAYNKEVTNILTKNIFPEFKFAWGFKSRDFKKPYSDVPTGDFAGNVNLLECNLVEGLPLLMNFKPQILLYRYKSKKKAPFIGDDGGFTFTKKAKFYHYNDKNGKRKTVIPLVSRKTDLDFGLEHFFSIMSTGTINAQGMKNAKGHNLYHRKANSEAHFYIQLRLQITINGVNYLSAPSETLRVYLNRDYRKISYERT